MVTPTKLHTLINKVKDISEEVNSERIQLNNPSLTPGKECQLRRSIALKQNKLKDYVNKVAHFGKGDIVKIIFEIYDEYHNRYDRYKATYVNISIDDAKDLLTFQYMIKGKEIKILETEKIPTSINRLVL